MRGARRPPRWPRCAAFATVADTSRLVCCSAPPPRRRFRWTWSLRGNWRSTARMEWPTSTRRCWRWSPTAPHRPDLLLGKVIGLEEAGTALAAMDRPSAGITVIELPHGQARLLHQYSSACHVIPLASNEHRPRASALRCACPEDGRSPSLLEPASREVSCQSED
jgi:hypothetical protein